MRLAGKHGLALFFWLPAATRGALPEAAKRFPDTQFVLDHTGVTRRADGKPIEMSEFDPVAEMAKIPNIALKWGHAPELGGRLEEFPFPTASKLLVRALEAFGRERVMYASDYTRARISTTWAETFFYILAHGELSRGDKEWVLAKTTRKILNWPGEDHAVPLGRKTAQAAAQS
jgi:predicted TIM-barrel fold metal-dependent hydrolase